MATTNLKIGDSVTVPGQMYGTLKFIGPVAGKRGIFAGVQLAPEYAVRGKNSGDVEGKHYFRTSVPGSGIFLPVDKAEKRQANGGITNSPTTLTSFNQGGRMPSAVAPKPNFSQSVGPGNLAMRAGSPAALKPTNRRESLPRPSSPLRKVNNAPTALTPAVGRLATPRTRPSLGLNRSTMDASKSIAGAVKSPAVRQPSRFGQSLRQSVRGPGAVTPSRFGQPPSSSASVTTSTTEESPLGPEPAFDESPPSVGADEAAGLTPTPAVRRNFKSKIDTRQHEEEAQFLREQLEDRDRQLNDQATSIAEMERSLQDLQTLINNMESLQGDQVRDTIEDEETLPKDVQELRVALREKNERIKAMTAEFDNNRADFRSTIDTLEMASTETERVYERRIEELIEEIDHHKERSEAVEGVAQQFRQLEELVAELEDGLEDARRGEAEARGEVEFLRGEVERGRSELRRERERNLTGDKLNGVDTDSGGGGGAVPSEEVDELHLKLDQKDDEIRGLKAIIQNMNNTAISADPNSKGPTANGIPFGHGHSKTKSTNTVISLGTSEDTAAHLQNQICELEVLLQQKSSREEELREEVTKLRQSVQYGPKFFVPGLEGRQDRNSSSLLKHQSIQSASTVTAGRSSGSSFNARRNSKREGGNEFVDAEQFPLNDPANDFGQGQNGFKDLDIPRTSDAASISGGTETSSNILYCEICEESGHDILTCAQMMGGPSTTKEDASNSKLRQRDSARNITTSDPSSRSATTGTAKDTSIRDAFRRSHESHGPPPDTNVPPPPPGVMARSSLTASATGPPSSTTAGNAARINTTSSTSSFSKRSSHHDDATARPAPLSMSRPSGIGGNLPRSPLASPTKSRSTQPNSTMLSVSTSASTSTPTQPPSHTVNTAAAPAASASKPDPNKGPSLIEGTGDQAGMLAGKESRVIDPDKWCALCERDGHDSVDCPIESAF